MVSCCGHQTLRKGQTFPFWQEGVLILIVRGSGVGMDFLSPIPQQWIVLGYETFHFLVPLPASGTCMMNIMEGLLCVCVEHFRVYEAL